MSKARSAYEFENSDTLFLEMTYATFGSSWGNKITVQFQCCILINQNALGVYCQCSVCKFCSVYRRSSNTKNLYSVVEMRLWCQEISNNLLRRIIHRLLSTCVHFTICQINLDQFQYKFYERLEIAKYLVWTAKIKVSIPVSKLILNYHIFYLLLIIFMCT